MPAQEAQRIRGAKHAAGILADRIATLHGRVSVDLLTLQSLAKAFAKTRTKDAACSPLASPANLQAISDGLLIAISALAQACGQAPVLRAADAARLPDWDVWRLSGDATVLQQAVSALIPPLSAFNASVPLLRDLTHAQLAAAHAMVALSKHVMRCKRHSHNAERFSQQHGVANQGISTPPMSRQA